MLLKYYYWWHQNVLPITFIDDIFKTVKNRKFEDATTIGADNKITSLKKQKKEKRDTKVIFLTDPWIYEATNPIVHAANEKAGWNFQWDYNEPVQFAKYNTKKYYGWHSDSLEDPYVYNRPNNPNHHNKMRKLSTIISLNDASEYEGGQVEFDYRNQDIDKHKTVRQVFECKELKRKGTVVTFPSHIWHRVKPVTKGTRYSLVIWHLGWPFR
jgi:PKHD-type hydroxylase